MKIIQAVKDFLKYFDEFTAIQLVAYVRWATNRPYILDATILRQLRKLRKEGWEIKWQRKTNKYKAKEIQHSTQF